MAGGGGGGKSTSTSEASYPAEFRPLADSARKEIEALQAALPLASFAKFQPAGVAGLSPVDQFTINELVMRTPDLPASFDNLMALPEPVGAATQGVAKTGDTTQAARGGLDFLSDFLGRNLRAEPKQPSSPFPVLTRLPTPETAFPGLSAQTLEGYRPNIAMQPTPMMTPLPSWNLPQPVFAQGGPPAAAAAAVNPATQLVPGAQQMYYEALAQGIQPQQAMEIANATAVANTAAFKLEQPGSGGTG